jgi:hypothetical protein
VSAIRRDAEGRIEVGRSWESLAERQIREAQEAGAFDDLPHRGERLPLEGLEDERWLAHNLLKQHRIAPPWIEADRDIRGLLERRDRILHRAVCSRTAMARGRDRAELTSIVEAANRAIFRLDYEAPTHRQHRAPLDLEAELARLADTHRAALDASSPMRRE